MSQFLREKIDLQKKLHDVPHKPGVYLMRDRINRVIYVGKARDLRKRVGQYFMPSRKMTADLKTRALLESIWDFEFHIVKSEPEAVLLEGKLIKDFRPKYNISFRDDKRFLLVKVDLTEEWPRFRLSRLKKDDMAQYYGPFASAGALRKTLAFMRKKFGVLTFGRGTPTPRELKSSTYQVPMKLADITAEQYRERVRSACEFFTGQSKELLEPLEEEMREAAEKLDFERAAELRNMLEDLRQTMKPMRRFTRHTLPNAIDPASDLEMLRDALQLSTPPAVMECFDISNISATHIVASMVCFRNGVPDRSSYRRFRIKTVRGQDDFASMAEVVRRRYSRILLEAKGKPETENLKPKSSDETIDYSGEFSQENAFESMQRVAEKTEVSGFTAQVLALPDLVIVDGGRGQLSSACKELQRLGLHEMQIIGLAKENEEIYRPGRPLPLQLPLDSGAVRILQRIRDEAHRFANSFHQLLMKRRIAESILDDCPGVSENRKKLLLQHFGSIKRLAKATPEEIASVEGIGLKLAETLVAFLSRARR
ncbi:MAG TPA: excinuclease ABC subunit UvrC [Chthoniobacterales bacterium]